MGSLVTWVVGDGVVGDALYIFIFKIESRHGTDSYNMGLCRANLIMTQFWVKKG
jgi:hypothetical protein